MSNVRRSHARTDRGARSDPRARILAAALARMARHGVEGTSLQQLADDVGIHKATLFYHFQEKQALAREVYVAIGRRLLPHFEALAGPGPPAIGRFIALAEGLAEDFAVDPAAAAFLMRALVAPSDSTFALDPADPSHPVTRCLLLLGRALDRAQRAGVIRRVHRRQAILHLLALVLFEPAASRYVGALGEGTRSARARREELIAFVHGALAP